MVEFQLSHSVVEGRRDRLYGSPLQCQLPVDAGALPLVELVDHLLGQGDDGALCWQIGLLPVVWNAAAFSLVPFGVERLGHARVALLKGA